MWAGSSLCTRPEKGKHMGMCGDNRRAACRTHTPIITVSKPPQVEAVQALLETGADPNVQNVRGDNTAHIAARAGLLEVT